MDALRSLIGIVLGLVIAALTYYLATRLLGGGSTLALVIAAVCGVIGGGYAAIALARNVYGIGVFGILGFLLDMTWSLLNTAAGLLVWLPACSLKGGNFVSPDGNSRRSGTFVYSQNPRGGGYAATTIGPVIGGGWNSHEELHVWQGRIFGPFYLVAYGFSWLWIILFRLIVGKPKAIDTEAYGRICYEDWAYWGGTSGVKINWGGWIAGFFLSLLFTSLLVAVPVGFVMGTPYLWLTGIIGLLIYGVTRALTPRSSP